MILKTIGKIIIKEASKRIQHELKESYKRSVLNTETVCINSSNAYECNVGDFVRFEKQYCMVIKKKTKYSKGMVMSLDLQQVQWHYQLTYNPYVKLVSDDGGCDIITNAVSNIDGQYNTMEVLKMIKKLGSTEYDPYRCPPNTYHFPIFEYIKIMGEGWYVPSINELKENLEDKTLQQRLQYLYTKVQNTILDKETDPIKLPLYIWSSTDYKRGNNRNYGESDALALLLSNDGTVKILSKLKNEKLMATFFHEF